ncbi:MAG: hypothetical protein ABI411_08705 [Tahibacter sp.]
MRDTELPVKTAAGLRELSERRLKLHARSRLLLIAIHGVHAVTELRQQFQTIGDVDQILAELVKLGLVEVVKSPTGAALGVAANESSNHDATDVVISPLMLARQFLNESAVAALGLRAFLFTLKLERCYTKPELHELLTEYHRVLAKAKGAPFADAMTARVRAMLARAT